MRVWRSRWSRDHLRVRGTRIRQDSGHPPGLSSSVTVVTGHVGDQRRPGGCGLGGAGKSRRNDRRADGNGQTRRDRAAASSTAAGNDSAPVAVVEMGTMRGQRSVVPRSGGSRRSSSTLLQRSSSAQWRDSTSTGSRPGLSPAGRSW